MLLAKMLSSRALQLLSISLFLCQVHAVPYSEYILAPPSRTLHPVSVHQVNGSVSDAASLTTGAGSASFQDGSAVTYDFSKNIAGLVSFGVGQTSGDGEYIGISFTESSLWISGEGCDATADAGIDEALWFHISEPGTYTASPEHQRGAFRYLNVIHNTTGTVQLNQLTVNFTAMPHFPDNGLQDYTGYFHCDDPLLNRVWYAGAYTNQLCTIQPTAGNALVHLRVLNSSSKVTEPVTWYNNYTITNGTSCLVDGAKRDREVWPGDMSIAVPSIFVSTNDLVTVRNSLESLLILQNSSGQLPYAGVPFNKLGIFSFTYHLYSLIGLSDYYTFSGDLPYLQANWGKFKLGLNYSLSQIDSSKLMNVSSSADWLRFGMGGHNIEANAILYYTINLGLDLASVLNDTSVVQYWQTRADGVKTAANALLWDAHTGLYRDNETTALHPRDGNAWAVLSNLTLNTSQIASISTGLSSRWTPYGAPAIEADNAISPFISGFELQAHYLAGQPQRAIDLMRFMWGEFMLDDPRMTNSTFIEGYDASGSLHYAPYTNDPRVSHAHGWATGPTSILSMYAAGIQPKSASGATWLMSPSPGNLTQIEAGFSTSLGAFNASLIVSGENLSYNFSTPHNTMGGVSIAYPSCSGTMKIEETSGACDITVDIKGETSPEGRIEIDGLAGGDYLVTLSCT